MLCFVDLYRAGTVGSGGGNYYHHRTEHTIGSGRTLVEVLLHYLLLLPLVKQGSMEGQADPMMAIVVEEEGGVSSTTTPSVLGLDELVHICAYLSLHEILALSVVDRAHRLALVSP